MMLCTLLGEPDERLCPNDWRLDRTATMTFRVGLRSSSSSPRCGNSPPSQPGTPSNLASEATAGHAEQVSVPLQVLPFFRRCVQAGREQTFRLRSEMAMVARTFRAEWTNRGDGDLLSFGTDADSEVLYSPPNRAMLGPAGPRLIIDFRTLMCFARLREKGLAILRRRKRDVSSLD